MIRKFGKALLAPAIDVSSGLARCVDDRPSRLLAILAGLTVGWWLYVPIHELLHALACVLAGGTVTRLEIRPEYGGALLARFLPFVVPGSEFAGRLAGFETGGSSPIFLATDLGPFVLTLFPGVWIMRTASVAKRSFAFGLSLPLALAPFLSLTGDAYEIGSILATALLPCSPASRELVRGDDVFRVVPAVATRGAAEAWGLVFASFVLGIVWAWLTYGAGWRIARKVERLRKTAA